MGFFNVLKDIATGQPVFKTPQQPTASQQNGQPVQPPAAQSVATGPKVIPQISIEEVDCDEYGTGMQCRLQIQNNSQVKVDIDRIQMLGSATDGGRVLAPGESRKFDVYSGPRPHTTGDNRLVIWFKNDDDPGKDLFQQQSTLEFRRLADGTHVVHRVRSDRIQDI